MIDHVDFGLSMCVRFLELIYYLYSVDTSQSKVL